MNLNKPTAKISNKQIKHVIVDMSCPNCITGTLSVVQHMYLTDRSSLPHICNGCGHKTIIDGEYPSESKFIIDYANGCKDYEIVFNEQNKYYYIQRLSKDYPVNLVTGSYTFNVVNKIRISTDKQATEKILLAIQNIPQRNIKFMRIEDKLYYSEIDNFNEWDDWIFFKKLPTK